MLSDFLLILPEEIISISAMLLMLGFPIAYGMARAPRRCRGSPRCGTTLRWDWHKGFCSPSLARMGNISPVSAPNPIPRVALPLPRGPHPRCGQPMLRRSARHLTQPTSAAT